MYDITESLITARDLLVNHGWTQGAMARNQYGDAVSPSSQIATCYCAEGAIRVSSKTSDEEETMLRYFRAAIGTSQVFAWNDYVAKNKEDVVKAFDKSIVLSIIKNHSEDDDFL